MTTTLIEKRTAREAERLGFQTFNGRGLHVCIDLDQAPVTISCRTPDGKLVTFAFIPRAEGEGHQCVDIQHHGDTRNEYGTPLQTASLLGQGPTVATTKPTDDVPTTLVVLRLPEG